MDYRDRDPPLTQDDVAWNTYGDTGTDQATCLYLPSGFAWYFDEDGEERTEFTRYGWTGIHAFVEDYGADTVQLQYGIDNIPTISDLEPVLEQVKEPTAYRRIGGMYSIKEEEVPPAWPEAWLWLNGEAWYFDSDGTPLPEDEELGWQGLHHFLDRYDSGDDQVRFRLAASLEETSVAQPESASVVREMLQQPE